MKTRYSPLLLIFLYCAVLGWFDSIQAASWETLPPDHWAYDEIIWLQAAGYLQELDTALKPYTRGQVARALQRHSIPAEKPILDRLNLLAEEFKAEMTTARGWETFVGGHLSAGLEGRHERQSQEAGYGVLSGGVGNPRMGIYTALRMDRDLAEYTGYKGKIWHNTAGLTEQAYLIITGVNQRWMLKLGRDHVSWGPGRDHLLLNNSPRGMDQINFRIGWRWGNFSALIGQLDDYTDLTGVRTSRFLTGHRFEFMPIRGLQIGLSETLLFTGGVRFGSMNPFLPFYGELVNENSEGNGMIGLDVNAYPCPGLQAYGEILLDDIQVEKKKPADLEPTEWGWLIGSRYVAFGGLVGIGLEYEGITNRTYNAIEEKYRYLSRGLPLGSEIGNDADRLRLDISSWVMAPVRVDVFWIFHRQGEGRVNAPFDTSYTNNTVAEGYNEPFPTGTIASTHTLGIGFWALYNSYFQAEGTLGYNWIKNVGNLSGVEAEGFQGRITLNVRMDHLYNHP